MGGSIKRGDSKLSHVTVEHNVSGAAHGRRHSKTELIAMVAACASGRQNQGLPCPDLKEWRELSSTRPPQLPSQETLSIYFASEVPDRRDVQDVARHVYRLALGQLAAGAPGGKAA